VPWKGVDKSGNFFVERVWDDVELIDVGEEGKDEKLMGLE
jgi:hypothetical protein